VPREERSRMTSIYRRKVSADHVPLLRMVEIRSVVEFDAAPLLLVNQEQKRIGR
jgi:hypothetical protein